jgi:hypothetical protein
MLVHPTFLSVWKCLHHSVERAAVWRISPFAKKRPGRAIELARRHLPECLWRQPQQAKAQGHRLGPGKGGRSARRGCQGSVEALAAPNVAVSSSAAI